MHQSFLLPLPQIAQPVIWEYAVDTFNLTPHPDYLVLADECEDYHHKIPVDLKGHEKEEPRFVNVLNPGNFAQD